MVIQHNLASMSVQNKLKINNNAVDKHMKRLSTGYRINSAADDAAGLAVSEKMRSQIHGLNQADRNALDGISLVQTAEGALGTVESMIQRMRQLAIQGANDTNQAEDREAIDIEVQQLKAEIDRVATSTQFNKKILLDGRYSTQLHTVEVPGDVKFLGDDLTDIGISSASFPPVVNPPTDSLWKVPKDSASDSITIYEADATGNHRVVYMNAGARYEGTLNKTAIGSGMTLTLNQTTNIITSPPNKLSLDVDADIIPKALAYLEGDYAYDYVSVPITTHAITAELRPNTDSNATASVSRGYSGYAGAGNNYGSYDDLGFSADIDFADPNHNANMGIKIEKSSERWTVPAEAMEENIPFASTGISNVRNTLGWTDTSSYVNGNGVTVTVTNRYTPEDAYQHSFYVSKVNGNLQYKMHAGLNRTYTETPPGNTYNYGTYGYDLTGVRSGNTVNFFNGSHLLYSFDITDAGLAEFDAKLTDNSSFDVGAYCFAGYPSDTTGQFSGVRTAPASYPDWGGSNLANISTPIFDETIIFRGSGTINFTIQNDGTIGASMTLDTEGDAAQDKFSATVTDSHVIMVNSTGQTIEFGIGDLPSLRQLLEWRDMTTTNDDTAAKYSVTLSNPPNSVSVKRQNDGSFLFELRKPTVGGIKGAVIMSGTCAGNAGTVTLDDSAYAGKGDKLTLNFDTLTATNPDVLENYLRKSGDTYDFTLYIDTINETATPQSGLSSSRGTITYPGTDIYGNAVDNPINNLTITCGPGTTDLGNPNPPTVTVRNYGNYYRVTVDTGESGSYYGDFSGASLPDTITTSYNGKTITVSGLADLTEHMSFYGDYLSGTLEWYNIQPPYIEESGNILAQRYPSTVEEQMGAPLWIQTGANEYQGLDVEIRCARIGFLGHPVSLSQVTMLTRENCEEALSVLDSALDDLSEIRADLGAYQNRLEYTIGNVKSTSENLTASESRIRDADMAAEMTEQSKANLLAQAGVSILAQANMSPQKLLQLLGG